MGGSVDLLELDDAGESQGDRPEPHADLALVAVLVEHLGQLGARHARCDAFDVEQHLPGLGGRQRHFERVVEFHDRSILAPVRRPSLMFGLNGMSRRTALLYSAMVLRNCSAFTPSSLAANSSIESATTLVICRILYSSRCRCFTFRSKICQANWPGCSSTTRP